MNLAVEFKSLNKSFGSLHANQDLCLKVVAGNVHAIVGENGAGKSTAMKLLYGTYQPDSGDIYIDGQLWGGQSKPWSSPSDAIRCGIGMVHQHFMLAGPHTVLDNIILGFEPSKAGWKFLPRFLRPIDRQGAIEKLKKIAHQYGISMDWDTPVDNLSVGVQQKIEILKLLYRNAKILILDEPSAVLTPQETAELFTHLKELCKQGKTIIVITHKLKEVMNFADRVTILRAGQVVGEREIQDTNVEDLATLMVGRKIKLQAENLPKIEIGKPVLSIKNVHFKSHHSLRNLNIQVKSGEIVGICGVEGNGQAELIQLLLHPKEYHQKMSGEIEIFGQNTSQMTTKQIKTMGVGVIPDDRLRDGLLVDRPVRESFILGIERRQPFSKNGILSFKSIEDSTMEAIKEYDIRPRSPQTHSDKLSGGNQQKLVIAREFKYSPKLILAAQPTRGVDVGAIEFIHKRIIRSRSEGSGILLISSELDEILSLSDRILVMYEGQIVAEFQRGAVTEKMLGLHMGGAHH